MHVPQLTLPALVLLLGASPSLPDPLLDAWTVEARQGDPGFPGFSVQAGQRFWTTERAAGNHPSCASCHGSNPRATGRHTTTGQAIGPMAPVVNPARLSDPAKVEKWFRRNCKDVLARECTPREKGDVVAFLRAIP